ncbi:hybrid sensor histidine kinase/response regulator [Desulfoluna spongiiphila]|uniref:Sensory/regulatory protein RpfC n=1 Tax=Desulfoluna spongiiphila TaxID=419481 RepID=A0A1G5DDJ1_9BACT|nr:response regulator [Desulfoluna spongiiphila]SCY12674.1 PAS domain S-box-containing protein [Desulfoluna spongiiphila]
MLQYVIRASLLLFWAAYGSVAPPSSVISYPLAFAVGVGYVAIQGFLFFMLRHRGAHWGLIRATMVADLGLAWVVWLFDPTLPPPLMLYTVIVIVGNAIQYGIRAFKLLAASTLVMAPLTMGLRFFFGQFHVTEPFLLFFCMVIVWYVYKFIFRIESFRRETIRRTEALAQSEHKYRSIFENTGGGAIIVEDNLVISQANARFEKITGFKRHEIEGKVRWIEFVEAGDLDRMRLEHKTRVQNGQEPPREYEFRLVRKDGAVIDVFSEVNYDPLARRSVASVIDISLRKQAERALKDAHDQLERRVEERTAEVMEANRQLKVAKEAADASGHAKSQFLANMSHEIRTPMNAIIGMCDLVLATDLSSRQKEYINIVRSSSRSLLELINDILDFSKIDAGKLDLETIPMSLRDVVEEVADMFLEKTMDKDLEMIIDIADDVPRKVISDPLRLRQVLANLTANAFKFTNRGEISLAVRTQYLDAKAAKLQFSVRDTGIGIEADKTGTLFDAFAQADGSTTRKYGGTGLGLAICRKIVTMLGGDIWVESEPGQGSTFRFTMEVRLLPDQATNPELALPPNLQGNKVLVVDDNPSTLMILKRYMETFGFRTEIAESAESALERYRRSREKDPFALVIMDIHLPAMDGIDAVAHIKEESAGEAPPVICISAYGRDREVDRAREAGADGFLMKPIKQSILFDTIMELFGFKAVRHAHVTRGLVSDSEFSELNLLLVEDNAINQMVAVEILKSAGISVTTAENGLEAINHLRTKSDYDAVLMDVQMPEMDGLEASRQIRKKLHRGDLPIIAMTAHAMYGDRERCLAAGMNDYVPKPIDRNELFAAIRRNIARFGGTFALPEGHHDTVSESVETQYMLPGINVSRGLAQTEGQWGLYGDMLAEFLRDHGDAGALLRHHLQGHAFDEMVSELERLVDDAGKVSVVHVATWAESLKEAAVAHDADRCGELFFFLEESLREVAASSRELLAGLEAGEDSWDPLFTAGPEKMFSLLGKLGKSLEELDPVESGRLFDELREGVSRHGVGPECRSLTSSLEQEVREYSFEKAGGTLKRLGNQLKKEIAAGTLR